MNISEIYSFYKSQIETHSTSLKSLKTRIYQVGTLRLLLIIGAIIAVWIYHDTWTVALAIAAVFLLPFILLIVYHTKLFSKRDFEEKAIALNENELKALDYDFSAFDGAPEQIDSQHSYSLDLDIFGEKSLFQSINRTVTNVGREKLIEWFNKPLDDKTEILIRQNGVKEISEYSDFRQRFYVTGLTSKGEKSIKINLKQTFSNNIIWKILIWIIPSIWAILIIGSILNIINSSIIGIYVAISFVIANLPAKQIQKIYMSFNKTERQLKAYFKLMELIENYRFESEILKENQSKLNHQKSASKAVKRLSQNIGALDQRFSLIGLILNILYLRDIRQTMNLEHWSKSYADIMPQWLDAMGTFDAFCSLGNFAFNHPDYIYPEIADDYFQMHGTDLGHPLIHRDKCVRNDVDIHDKKYFMIITGANMAGKSTYLRTVGVNFLLACIGAPVCAKSLTVYPAHIVTSLRTADSLASNESYFFAELKRLKMIIDRLDTGEKLFIILDEILKGTNSTDKQKGSISLMKKLVDKGTCGIIATHDLLLGSLAETFPSNVCNKRFEADIQEDNLVFNYKLRDGIAQNMNATFLMKKMGISDT